MSWRQGLLHSRGPAGEGGVMGAADGEAKVNRDAFRAGGGSNGDLDGGTLALQRLL